MRHTRIRRLDLDWREAEILERSNEAILMIKALAAGCPWCSRPPGRACRVPEDLAGKGLLIHHERLALVTNRGL
jgi:hypothetical protein